MEETEPQELTGEQTQSLGRGRRPLNKKAVTVSLPIDLYESIEKASKESYLTKTTYIQACLAMFKDKGMLVPLHDLHEILKQKGSNV
jgi:hypothetical protein